MRSSTTAAWLLSVAAAVAQLTEDPGQTFGDPGPDDAVCSTPKVWSNASSSPYCTAATAARTFENAPFEMGEHDYTFPSDDATCEFAGQTAKIAMIHVGKTAGTTLSKLVIAAGVPVTPFHEIGTVSNDVCTRYSFPYSEALDCRFTHYIVPMREPINRTISAFNFGAGSYDVGAQHETKQPAFYKLYETCFPKAIGAMSAFAEALGADSDCGNVARACLYEPAMGCSSHLARGMSYIFRDTGLLDVRAQPQRPNAKPP